MTLVPQPSRRAASAAETRRGGRDPGPGPGRHGGSTGPHRCPTAGRGRWVSGGVQPGDQFVVAGGWPEPLNELDGGGRGSLGCAGVDGPADGEFVGGAGVPADPDPCFAAVGLGQHGDVGDQGAQQPFAVPGAGGRRVPQGGQVSGEFLQVVPARQRRQRVLGGLQRLIGFSQGGEPGLPAGLQGAGDQPVLRLDLAERAFGAVGVVAGTLNGQLGGPADALAAAGHLVGR